MEHMNSLDAGMFFAEDRRAPLTIASVTVLEGPPPSHGELVEEIGARLSRVPRHRQRVRTVPLNLGLPVWEDDPRFRLERHLRDIALAAPGGRRELEELVAQIMTAPLDLDRPPWEIWRVTGLAGGRWALLGRIHHCVVDGVGAGGLISEIFDLEPRPAGTERVARGSRAAAPAQPPPSALSLTLDALAQGTRPAWTLARRLARPPSPSAGLGALRGLGAFAGGLPDTVRHIARHGVTSLDGPSGPGRRWATCEVDLDQVKAIRNELGGTVNDIVLAAVTRGFRDLLAGREDLTDRTLVRALVPVSVRGTGTPGDLGNRVSALIVTLPAGQADPLRRLASLRAQMDVHKDTRQTATVEILLRLAGTAPMLLPRATRTFLTAVTPAFQTIATNVPGPQFPLYVLGRKVVAHYPYVPVALGAGISIGIFSYLGRLYFGVTADRAGAPDLHTLVAGIEAGFAELRNATSGDAPAEASGPSDEDGRAAQGRATVRYRTSRASHGT